MGVRGGLGAVALRPAGESAEGRFLSHNYITGERRYFNTRPLAEAHLLAGDHR